MISDKAVKSPQAGKERTFHVHMLVESLCILGKNTFYNSSSALSLFSQAILTQSSWFQVELLRENADYFYSGTS